MELFMQIIYFLCAVLLIFYLLLYSRRLREYNEEIEKENTEYWDKYQYWRGEDYKKEIEIEKLKNTNRAYKGANTKHKATIDELRNSLDGAEYRATSNGIGLEELEGELEKLTKKSVDMLEEQGKKIDESKPMCEKLLTMVKKGNMEEAKAVVKEFYQM